MFKENFINLCNKKGVSPSAACRAVGITPATFSCWTSTTVPRKATLLRISEYFGVTVNELLGEEQQKKTVENDSLSENKQKLIAFARDVPEEKAELLLRVMKSILEDEE